MVSQLDVYQQVVDACVWARAHSPRSHEWSACNATAGIGQVLGRPHPIAARCGARAAAGFRRRCTASRPRPRTRWLSRRRLSCPLKHRQRSPSLEQPVSLCWLTLLQPEAVWYVSNLHLLERILARRRPLPIRTSPSSARTLQRSRLPNTAEPSGSTSSGGTPGQPAASATATRQAALRQPVHT